MVVKHNLQAMNANRMLGINTGATSHSTEKLSSGYKINRAADNAAGLAISEKMRKQIRGLTQASANAEDGISCVQTAEGALAEVQDMLQRMNELCVQAANGTNSISDRQYIQDEIDELVTEIDRVSETTKFNELYLLKGDAEIQGTHSIYTIDYQVQPTLSNLYTAGISTPTYDYTYIGNQNIYMVETAKVPTTPDMDVTVISTDVIRTGNKFTQYMKETSTTATGVLSTTYSAYVNTAWNSATDLQNGTQAKAGGVTLFDMETETFVLLKANADMSDYIDSDNQLLDRYRKIIPKTTWDLTLSSPNKEINLDTSKRVLYDSDGEEVAGMALYKYYDNNGNYKGGLFKDKIADATSVVPPTATAPAGSTTIGAYVTVLETKVANDLQFNLHVGADGTKENKIMASIRSISAAGIGINKLHSNRIGIVDATGANAAAAIDVIGNALILVSKQRSLLGATQNRIDHTILNLNNVVENTTSAESTIRDTDMADEMVEYSNKQILIQAGQSILAQANQSNQGVLSLLQ